MQIIKLNQRCKVERQGEHGWDADTVYEPIYVVTEHIESFYYAGVTCLKKRSGETIEVAETPEEIMELLGVAPGGTA